MHIYNIYMHAHTHIYKFLAFVVHFLGYSTSLFELLNQKTQWILSQFWRSEAEIIVKVELLCSGALAAPPSVCIWVLIPASYKETNLKSYPSDIILNQTCFKSLLIFQFSSYPSLFFSN